MKSPNPKLRNKATHINATLDRLAPFLRGTRTTSAKWSEIQSDFMHDTFHAAAKHVSAYQRFLKKHGCNPKAIRSVNDFKNVPPVGKTNYLLKSLWSDLIIPGGLAGKPLVMTATSGSTGKPFYFPRTSVIDEQSYVYHRNFLQNSGLDPAKPTLVIVAFGMGVWIGGIITYEAFKRISERDFPLTILTPGVNMKEIYGALHEIGPDYSQVVLCGYPPFIKDIIDDGPQNGISWKRFDLRIVCAAETFSEDFRTYLLKHTDMRDPYRDVMNIYGSAELGTMATETPLTTLIRGLSLKEPRLFKKLFNHATRLPTLAQFIPSFVSFEAVDNRIYCTAGDALPLVRYDIGDHGGVHTFTHINEILASEGIDLKAAARKADIADTILELPFVYVYERADLSTKLYGAIIFPEHVKRGLASKAFEKFVTTKFTMSTKNDARQNEYLEINIELKEGVVAPRGFADTVADAVMQSLIKNSTEHKNNVAAMGDRVRPRIIFWPHNHHQYFVHGGKHPWVKKS